MEQTLRGSDSVKPVSDSVKSGTKPPTHPPPEPAQTITRVQRYVFRKHSLPSLGASLLSEHSTPCHSCHLSDWPLGNLSVQYADGFMEQLLIGSWK